jgi:3-oxoadipate enol-lactonase
MAIVWIDKMAVDTRGDGDAVVMLHGLGGSMNAWTPLLPALTRYRTVRIELPGAGRSKSAHALADSAPEKGQLSIEVLTQAVMRVCDALGLQRAHLVGHSMGTLVCQHLAVKAPSLVRSMSLFGAMAEPGPALRDGMPVRAAKARAEGMFEIAEGISDFALSASSKETQPTTVAYVREGVASQDPEGFARNCLALAQAKATTVALIRCPVLIVNGDEDLVTTLSGARALAAQLPNARVEVLGRCGHWPMFERAVESQRLLRDFLDRVR